EPDDRLALAVLAEHDRDIRLARRRAGGRERGRRWRLGAGHRRRRVADHRRGRVTRASAQQDHHPPHGSIVGGGPPPCQPCPIGRSPSTVRMITKTTWRTWRPTATGLRPRFASSRRRRRAWSETRTRARTTSDDL